MDVIICNPPPRAIKRRKKRSDLISNLPDHILIHILSFLPPDRAVLTCILSNRWRHLWTFSTNLTFAIDMPLQKFRNWYRSHDIVVKQCKFVSFVDKFLQLHCAPTVQKFRLCFGPLIEHVPLVENWIDLAMAKNVEQLELDFHYSNFVYYGDGELGQAAYGTPKLSRHPVFVSLKTLFLSNVKISDETFQVLVSNSPGIQSISLTDCVDLVHLRISSPNLSLKSLTVNECFWLEEIEICTPNLVSFQFQGHPAHFTLHDLRSLVDAMFIFVSGLGGIFSDSRYKRTTHGITKLLTDIAHVEILTISGHFLEFIVAAGKKLEGLLNPFCNLKELQLKLQMHLYERADLSVISCVISSCLNLERLFIDVGDNSRREQAFAEGYYPNAWPTSHFCVHHIKTVKITGFKGRCREIELVKLLLEKSKFIESLIIIVPQEISRKGYATELLRHAKELVRICQQLLSFPRASEVCRIVLFPSYEDTSLSPTHVLNSI